MNELSILNKISSAFDSFLVDFPIDGLPFRFRLHHFHREFFLKKNTHYGTYERTAWPLILKWR